MVIWSKNIGIKRIRIRTCRPETKVSCANRKYPIAIEKKLVYNLLIKGYIPKKLQEMIIWKVF